MKGFVRGCVLGLSLVFTASAQDVSSYRVGERVEYKASSYPEKWRGGTVVKLSPEYKQLIVRWDPGDYPTEYQQAYPVSDVRHLGAAPAAAPTPEPAPAAPATAATAAAAPLAAGGPPMTKAEILAAFRAAPGGAKSLDACRAVISRIKARGVVEPLGASDDVQPIAAAGCFGAQDTDVVAASRTNIGAPVGTSWLAGTWAMVVIGGTVDTLHADGWIYRQNESIAKLGFLKIENGGAYTWKVDPTDPPEKYVHGHWRLATPAEMVLQGGAGIVLEHAAEGADWIAFKRMTPGTAAATDSIEVEHLQSRGSYRRIGWRT